MKKEKSLTIELDEVTYEELETLAREKETKLEDEIGEALRTYIEWRKEYRNDPFFKLQNAGKSGLKDLAKEHDKYLYGFNSANDK